MKKHYDVPFVEVLFVFENDVISTSDHTGKDIYDFDLGGITHEKLDF